MIAKVVLQGRTGPANIIRSAAEHNYFPVFRFRNQIFQVIDKTLAITFPLEKIWK
jgi:hypothetical protein